MGKLSKVAEKQFEAPRTKNRYRPPLFLIRENERLQCAFWEDGFLAYRAQVVGIRVTKKHREQLLRCFQEFRNNRPALRAFCLLLGTRALAVKATAINKTDIENLPWPRSGESWDLAPWETTLCEDVVNYMAEYVRLGQDSKLLRERVTDSGLCAYAEEFRAMLGSIYGNLRVGWSRIFDGLACQSFHFGEQPDLEWPGDWSEPLRKLIYVRNGAALRTVRVLRFYESNVIFVVKPDRLRYWIRSTAIRDADETLTDLRKQGF